MDHLKKKTFWTEKIINENKLKRSETLFIGDASTDYIAAKYSSIKFCLREDDYNYNYFKNKNVFKFKHFNELSNQLGL